MKIQKKQIPRLMAVISCLITMPNALAALPPGLNCNNGSSPICEVEISDTIRFIAPSSQIDIEDDNQSFVMTGNVQLESPAGNMTLAESEIVFQPNVDLETFAFEVYGFAIAPLPALPLFKDAEINFQPRAAVGVVSRQTLQTMFEKDPLSLAENFKKDNNGYLELNTEGKPILREPAYVMFHYDASPELKLPLAKLLGFNVEEGAHNPLEFELPSSSLTFILDPSDPYFFFSQERSADKKEHPKNDLTVNKDLLAQQDKMAVALDDMLSNGSITDSRRFQSARENLYRLNAAQLAGLSNDLLASYSGDPKVETIKQLTQIMDDSKQLASKAGNQGLLADGNNPAITPETTHYAIPGLIFDNRPAHRNPDTYQVVDVDLRVLQDHSVASLDELLSKSQLDNQALFEHARKNIYQMNVAQISGLSNEVLASYTGEPRPDLISDITSVLDDSRDIYTQRTGKELTDQDMDFRKIRSAKNTNEDKNKDNKSTLPSLDELAFSVNGGIPFQPETIWGLPEDIGKFKGHLYLKAPIPLSPTVVLQGKTVVYLGSDGLEMGGNGEVELNIDIIEGFLSFNFPLGSASAGIKITNGEQSTYFSGIIDPDLSWLPKEIPFVPQNAANLAGFISSARPEDTLLIANGTYGYDAAGLSTLIGLQLNDILLSEVAMRIDRNGVFVRGRSALSIHPSINTGGELIVEVLASPQAPLNSYLKMQGSVEIAGIGISPATIYAGGKGLLVDGQFVTPLTTISLAGKITNQGPSLKGSAEIIFPLDKIAKAADDAQAGVGIAQAQLDKANYLLDTQRSTVINERNRDQQRLKDAKNGVGIAQSAVNSLKSKIAANYRNISSWKRQISSKYRWYKKQKWYKKPRAWGVYTAYKSYRNIRIAVAYTAIGALKVSKAVSTASLNLAKTTLTGIQAGISVLPIDADPRVIGLIAGVETAQFTLKQTQIVLAAVPRIDAEFKGIIDVILDKSGIKGNLNATLNGYSLSKGQVVFGKSPKACISIATVGEICTPF